MIPDFRTYLNESLWADVQSQASGGSVKKEDDVDLLDIERFMKYLKDRYSETARIKTHSVQIRAQGHRIYIPILPYSYNAGYELVYDMNKNHLYIHDRTNNVSKFPKDLKFLRDKYSPMSFDSLGYSLIFTLLGKKVNTNKQVIELIDYIIDNYKGDGLLISRKVSESLWADVQSQASGVEKKEDVITLENIDDRGIEGLVKYIRQNYEHLTGTDPIEKLSGEDILIYISPIYYIAVITYALKPGVISQVEIPKGLEGHFFNDNYYVDPKYKENDKYVITSRNHMAHLDNSEVIDILDTLLEIIKNPTLIKKEPIKESLWADVQSQAAGTSVKTEDDLDILDSKRFVEYLIKTYKVIVNPHSFSIDWWYNGTGETIIILLPIEMNDYNETPNLGNRELKLVKDIQNNEFLKITPNKFFFRLYPNELQETFGDDYDLDVNEFTLTPKNGKITNTVCIDVIDKLLSIVENPTLKKKHK